MSGSISLAEKLAVAGAFCALVVLAVGTEDDPGIIAATIDTVAIKSGEPAGTDGQEKVTNYWSVSDEGTPPPITSPIMTASPSPKPERLPPGFGATPSPALPM